MKTFGQAVHKELWEDRCPISKEAEWQEDVWNNGADLEEGTKPASLEVNCFSLLVSEVEKNSEDGIGDGDAASLHGMWIYGLVWERK